MTSYIERLYDVQKERLSRSVASTSVVPDRADEYDLGATDFKWRQVHATSLHAGQLFCKGSIGEFHQFALNAAGYEKRFVDASGNSTKYEEHDIANGVKLVHHSIVPFQEGPHDLGSEESPWDSVFGQNMFMGSLNPTAIDDTILTVANIVPNADVMWTLGTPTNRFESVYAADVFVNNLLVDSLGAYDTVITLENHVQPSSATVRLGDFGTPFEHVHTVGCSIDVLNSNSGANIAQKKSFDAVQGVGTIWDGLNPVHLYGDSVAGSLVVGGNVVSTLNNAHTLGDAGHYFSTAFVETINTKYIDPVSGNLTLKTGGIEPQVASSVPLGTVSKPWANVYADNLVGGVSASSFKLHKASGQTNLYVSSGDSSAGIYLTNTDGAMTDKGAAVYYSQSASSMYFSIINGGASSTMLSYNSSTIFPRATIRPFATLSYDLGSAANEWRDVYCQTLTQSSDIRKKQEITDIDPVTAEAFLSALQPKRFQFVVNQSERFHTGVIAQQVHDAMLGAGMTPSEEALWIEGADEPNTDNDPNYVNKPQGVRYNELIPYIIAAWQTDHARMLALEARVSVLEGQ